MFNYIERNRPSLEKYHYIRFDGNDFSQLDLHYARLDEYKVKYNNNFCLVFYGHRYLDDSYIIPFVAVKDIFVPSNFCVEVGENYENNRERWKFSIERHELRLFSNTRLDKLVPPLEVSKFRNLYPILGPTAMDIESFPAKLTPLDRPVHNNLFDQFKPIPPKGFVYFIEDIATGNIKIGFSTRPESRLRDLQTGCSGTLKLLLAIPGTKSDERDFHRRFYRDRIREDSEWFEPGISILEFIEGRT